MKWLKRILIGLVATLFAAIILAAVFISPITKYLIENYSKQIIGRQVKIGSLFLNFFSGTMSISNLKIYEANDKDVFFSCEKLSANVTVKKMLIGQYEINRLEFKTPAVKIFQNGNHFSYDDIVDHFSSPRDTLKKDTTAPVKYWLRNIEITNGDVYYLNAPINNITEIRKLNFRCSLIAWDDPNTKLHADFSIATGGNLNTDLAMNMSTLDYDLKVGIEKFNLSQFYLPLREYLKVAKLNGSLDAALKFKGNFNEIGDIATSGTVALNNVAIKDSLGNDFASFSKFQIQIDTLNVKQDLYDFHKIILSDPFFKFDLYKDGSNLSQMMVSETSTDSATTDTAASESASTETSGIDYSNVFTLMGSYVKEIAANYIVSNYSADSIVMNGGHFIYDDYTLNDRFTYDVSNTELLSGKINSANERITMTASSKLNHTGDLTANVSATPDFKTMDINYEISNIKVSDFNAYSRYYVATPFFDGTMHYKSENEIVNQQLKSSNKITITQLTAGKKIDEKPVYSMPVRLAVSLLKDVHGNINLDIPVEGNLSDPNYKLGKVIWQIVENLVVKAASAPVHLIAGMFDNNEEEMKEIPFEYLQKNLATPQFKKLDDIVTVLKAKPELNVELVQLSDTFVEREQLASLEAKTKFYVEQQAKPAGTILTDDDLSRINQIQNTDSAFNKFLDRRLNIGGNDLVSVQEKSVRLIGAQTLDSELLNMMESRNQQVLKYLSVQKAIPVERIKVSNNHDPSKSDRLSQPRYLINYNAD